MCGRYMITAPLEALVTLFGAEPDGVETIAGPRPDIRPTETVPVVVSTARGRRLVPMRWGFIPAWYAAPNAGPLLINARAETIAAKPAFRQAVRARRCLLPADGFYEWQAGAGGKTAFTVRPAGPGPIAFAGIWQSWGEPRIDTCAIVTCPANATLAPIHERMPVIIGPSDFALWLGEAGHGAAVLMAPAPDEALVAEPADEATRSLLARSGRRAAAAGDRTGT
jgi:putative SOS response-associated peptidase YedK